MWFETTQFKKDCILTSRHGETEPLPLKPF